jgi:hypothetical protein
MSQQEFVPPSESNQQHPLSKDDEKYQPQYPYHWSGMLNQEGAPRDEPPSTYDPTIMQQGYQAQASGPAHTPFQGSQQSQGAADYIVPGSDGDAYEQGYRPYNAYNAYNARQAAQGVPPWARPQHHRRNPLRFGFIILILLGIGLLQGIIHMGSLAAIFGGIASAFIGLLLFAIFVPLIIVFVILGIIVRMFRPRRAWYWRRGPWW